MPTDGDTDDMLYHTSKNDIDRLPETRDICKQSRRLLPFTISKLYHTSKDDVDRPHETRDIWKESRRLLHFAISRLPNEKKTVMGSRRYITGTRNIKPGTWGPTENTIR